MKVGDFYYHGKLKYVCDEINADGTCNGHLVEVMKDEPEAPKKEAPSDVAESPIEAVETEVVENTTDKPKRTYTRRTTKK